MDLLFATNSAPQPPQITELRPGLWIGSENGCLNHMKEFDAIVTLIEDFVPQNKFKFERAEVWRKPWLCIPVVDGPESTLSGGWEAAVAFVNFYRKQNKKVLVHCWAGMSRSVSTCMAIMRAETPRRTFLDILGEIGDKWPRAKPKIHWFSELEDWWAKRAEAN